MKKNILILSTFLFALFITSCSNLQTIVAPENLRFGMIGGTSYLVGTWDGISGIDEYEIFYNNNSKKWSKYDTVKNKYYILQKVDESCVGYDICVQGKNTIGKRTTVLPYFAECKYDYENKIISWTDFPIDTSYLLIESAIGTSMADTLSEKLVSKEGYKEYNFCSTNSCNCEAKTGSYYAVYVLIGSNYIRMTKWYNGESLKPQLKLSSYKTGSKVSFDLKWEECTVAKSYSLYIKNMENNANEWKLIEKTTQPNITVDATSLSKYASSLDETYIYYFQIEIKFSDSEDINLPSVYTNTLQIPVPKSAWNYKSNCTILDDVYDTNLIIMRTGSNTFKAYWNNQESYYLSSFKDKKIMSWMNNGIYKTGQSIRADDFGTSRKFFLHRIKDWNYDNMDRSSNYVLVELE